MRNSARRAIIAPAAAALAAPLAAQPAIEGEPTVVAVDANGTGDGSASADGRFIAASSTRLHGESAIWLFDRRAGSWRQLTQTGNGDREPAISPDGRYVAFISDRDERTDIWAIEVATGSEFALTADDMAEEYPSWSHDGRQIVFTGGPWKARNFYTLAFAEPGTAPATPRAVLPDPGHVGACTFTYAGKLVCHVYEGSAGNLVAVDPATGASQPLTDGGWWFYKPNEAPDGWIATTVIGDAGETIRFMPAGGGGDPLPTPQYPGSWPQFVREGRELVYHRQVNEGTGLMLIDLARGTSRDLAVQGRIAGFASLSPDGRQVAYCLEDGERRSVRLRDVGSGMDRTLAIDGDACNPAFSPDGTRLAISLREGDHWAQAVVRTDASEMHVLHRGTGAEWQLDAPAAWSPDGKRLAFAATTAPYESDLFVADLASGAVRNITGDAWYDEGPSWSADGASIVFMSTRGGDWTWGLFAISPEGGEAIPLVEPDWIERRFPQQDADGTVWWIESDLCLGATYVVRQSKGAPPEKLFDYPGAAWLSRAADRRTAVVPITRKRVEYLSLSLSAAP